MAGGRQDPVDGGDGAAGSIDDGGHGRQRPRRSCRDIANRDRNRGRVSRRDHDRMATLIAAAQVVSPMVRRSWMPPMERTALAAASSVSVRHRGSSIRDGGCRVVCRVVSRSRAVFYIAGYRDIDVSRYHLTPLPPLAFSKTPQRTAAAATPGTSNGNEDGLVESTSRPKPAHGGKRKGRPRKERGRGKGRRKMGWDRNTAGGKRRCAPPGSPVRVLV